MAYGNRNARERRIFFPWEARGGIRRYFAARRIAPPVVILLLLSITFIVARRERRLSGERQTRATLLSVRRAVSRYLVEHKNKCPMQLTEVLPQLNQPTLPRDAWGQHFRLICPAKNQERAFLIMSDGADGKPGGRDRIEF